MTSLTTCVRRGVQVGLLVAVGLGGAGTANAQSNAGALHVSGAVDMPSLYVFRGLIQESNPGITAVPSADLSITLGDAVVTLGTWHALLTGSSGLDGPTARLHYEERVSAGVALPIGGGLTAGATWTAYTSPNVLFDTRQELALRVARRGWLNPYGLVAFELEGAADGIDDGTGSYLELGVGPRLDLGAFKGSLAVPVKVGLSLQNYYQGFSGDSRLGFFDVGAHISVPIGRGGAFGAWEVHGGADLYVLGDTAKLRNAGEQTKVVALVGLGFRY